MSISTLHEHPEHTSLLHAMKFTGPNGMTLVRLAPEALLKAEELALNSVSLKLTEQHTVGCTVTRAVGFPAWPIITDPKNAQHALNLVGDLEWAKRNVEHSAGKVKERFNQLITTLTKSAPHFVPTLLEELARLFAGVNNTSFAKQYFNKAREVERAYALEVDPERHFAMFAEFASLGAIGAREFTAEAKSASERLSPQEAYDYFLKLCISRGQSGASAYTGMPRDLRKLAKAIGMSPLEADKALLDGIIEYPGFYSASEGFFKALKSSLPTLATNNPTYQEALLVEKPKELSIESYFTLLHDSGAFTILAADKNKLAEWLVAFIAAQFNSQYYWFEKRSQQLIDAVLIAGDALAGKKLTPYSHLMNLDLMDALSAGGVVWDFTDDKKHSYYPPRSPWIYKWSDWFATDTYSDAKVQRRDLGALVANDRLRAELAKALTARDIKDNLDLLLEYEATRTMVSIRLERYATKRENITGSADEWHSLLQCLPHLTDPRVRNLNSEACDRMFAFDPAEELQRRLQYGLSSELTWPAVEEALARLRAGAPNNAKVQFFETNPAVAIRVGDTIEVIDGDQVVARGEIPADVRLRVVYLVGNRIFVMYDTKSYDTYTCWLGETAVLQNDYRYYSNSSRIHSIPLGDTRLIGSGALEYPNTIPIPFRGNVLGTGPHYLADYNEIRKWETNEEKSDDFLEPIGRGESLPGIDLTGVTIPPIDPAKHFQPTRTTIITTQPTTRDSLCGTHNGQHIALYYSSHSYYSNCKGVTLWTPLGCFTSEHDIIGAISRPGGGTWLLGRFSDDHGRNFIDAESDLPLYDFATPESSPETTHYINQLPISAYHQLQVRNLDMSINLRATTYEQATELLATPTTNTIERLFGTDPVLVEAINHVVANVQNLHNQLTNIQNLDALVGDLNNIAVELNNYVGVPRSLSEKSAKLLSRLIDRSSLSFPWDDHTLTNILANPSTDITITPALQDYLTSSKFTWWELLGREKLIVSSLAEPLLPAENVIELCEWCLDNANNGLLGSGWQHREFTEPQTGTMSKNTWWHGAFIYGDDTRCRTFYNALIHPDHTDMDAFQNLSPTYPNEPDYSLTKEQFVADITAIKQWAEQRPTNSTLEETTLFGGTSLLEAANFLATNTILLPETARCLLGGATLIAYDYDWYVTDAKNRSTFGLTTIQAKAVEVQLCMINRIGVFGVDTHFNETGLNLDAIRTHLIERYGESITAPTVAHINEVANYTDWYTNWSSDPIEWAFNSNHNLTLTGKASIMGSYLAILLYLINQVSFNDPRRQLFAQKLTHLKTYSLAQEWESIGTMELGCDFEDKRFSYRVDRNSQAIRALTEGHLDDLITSLSDTHDHAGTPFDPCVSAPDVVAEVAQKLDVPEDSARYFLQILALIKPSDANIRVWNGWRKKNIDQAAAPLVDKGLLIEAKRAGAGRSRFLPGGWLEKDPESMPLEVWKVPHYLLWQAPKSRPIIKGCPPVQSLDRLFAEVWERYKSGDIPGYEELKTTRYRRR